MTFWLKFWGTSQFVIQVQDEIHASLSEVFRCGDFHDPMPMGISVLLLLQSMIIKVITTHNLPHLTGSQSNLKFNILELEPAGRFVSKNKYTCFV